MDLHGATVNSVDASGRITLREHQADELDGSVVLTQGFDENLLMFSPQQWPHFAEKLQGGNPMDPDLDDLRRLFLGAAVEVEMDDRSRVKIPEALRQWAGLKPGQSKAMIINIGTRWEIWSQDRYNEYLSERRTNLKELARRRFGDGGEDQADTPAEEQ
jgi:MraZ protein